MNWHETILSIREKPEYDDLVKVSYLGKNLAENIEQFGKGEEFLETLRIIGEYAPGAKTLLDIGAGNGISSINFALKGFDVTAVEPDHSDTVGSGAILKLKELHGLSNVRVQNDFAEQLNLPSNHYDVVYFRQAMHHAQDLKGFIKESTRVLKPGGLMLTVRDHVIFDDKDRERFLASHPLQKYYGGENAFTPSAYKAAMSMAGLTVLKEIKYYDSIINYFPFSRERVDRIPEDTELVMRATLKKKLGFLAQLPFVFELYKLKNGYARSYFNERKVPGRMYSYIARK